MISSQLLLYLPLSCKHFVIMAVCLKAQNIVAFSPLPFQEKFYSILCIRSLEMMPSEVQELLKVEKKSYVGPYQRSSSMENAYDIICGLFSLFCNSSTTSSPLSGHAQSWEDHLTFRHRARVNPETVTTNFFVIWINAESLKGILNVRSGFILLTLLSYIAFHW